MDTHLGKKDNEEARRVFPRDARWDFETALNCGTVAVGERPLSLAGRLAELEGMGARCFRADFAWLDYTPEEARGIWRALRRGDAVPGREGNYVRGLA